MDQIPLVSDQVEDGRRLLERLTAAGVEVTGAAWLKESENGRWYLHLASSLVGADGGTRAAYQRIVELIRQMPPPFWLDPLRIRAVEESGPLAAAVQELQRHNPGRRLIPFEGSHLGGVNVEAAYVYPPVGAAEPTNGAMVSDSR